MSGKLSRTQGAHSSFVPTLTSKLWKPEDAKSSWGAELWEDFSEEAALGRALRKEAQGTNCMDARGLGGTAAHAAVGPPCRPSRRKVRCSTDRPTAL